MKTRNCILANIVHTWLLYYFHAQIVSHYFLKGNMYVFSQFSRVIMLFPFSLCEYHICIVSFNHQNHVFSDQIHLVRKGPGDITISRTAIGEYCFNINFWKLVRENHAKHELRMSQMMVFKVIDIVILILQHVIILTKTWKINCAIGLNARQILFRPIGLLLFVQTEVLSLQLPYHNSCY